jgi:hypothetical protein
LCVEGIWVAATVNFALPAPQASLHLVKMLFDEYMMYVIEKKQATHISANLQLSIGYITKGKSGWMDGSRSALHSRSTFVSRRAPSGLHVSAGGSNLHFSHRIRGVLVL